ncbi:MAG: hypothetical protein RBR59_04085 [Sulfurimonadaceae bacterium]|jgi:hypothetical protein|nr:hypothetical protein [Sulfurimonadaceae bacterium]
MIKPENDKLFTQGATKEILAHLERELVVRKESPFWGDKVLPFTEAILSVLVPLQKMELLFDPEGNKVEVLDAELFLKWSDFVSLKTLAFTLQRSNKSGMLERTKLPQKLCQTYEPIELEKLGAYLSNYTVNLENEALDFPISNYNLHQGVSSVIKSLLS